MNSREKSLRRILEATGAGRSLDPDQKDEIVTHLEDAVDGKIREGLTESEAVAQALEEMGDLERIADEYPSTQVALTADGVSLLPSPRTFAYLGSFLLFQFSLLQCFVLPLITQNTEEGRIRGNGLVELLSGMSDLMSRHWPAVLLLVALTVIGFWYSAKAYPKWTRRLGGPVLLLLIGLIAGTFYPYFHQLYSFA